METACWLDMLDCQQQLHCFSRELLSCGSERTLTVSQLELLSLLYLKPEENTPLSLSRESGMKKEAVSRCVRQLEEKGCISREKHPRDERSFLLTLTEKGREELQASYRPILEPLYALRRQMGEDFDALFALIAKANRLMAEPQGGTHF